VEELIAAEISAGIPSTSILVGGFSQGEALIQTLSPFKRVEAGTQVLAGLTKNAFDVSQGGLWHCWH